MSTAQNGRERFLAGFSDPVMDGQRTFRTVLNAMSQPGRIFRLELDLEVPAPLHHAAGAVALSLLDFETPVWADLPADSEAIQWLRFHCGCPLVQDLDSGSFGLITMGRTMPGIDQFNPGLDEFPGTSATLIIQVARLASGHGQRLTGPGVEKEHHLEALGLPDYFWAAWKANHSLYPLGVDLILTAGRELTALPRTTRAE